MGNSVTINTGNKPIFSFTFESFWSFDSVDPFFVVNDCSQLAFFYLNTNENYERSRSFISKAMTANSIHNSVLLATNEQFSKLVEIS